MEDKKRKIVILIIIFISIAGVILPKGLNNLDELWNYNFARNIADGLLPYKDFNMVQMPLLPLICGIMLKFSNELIIMRIIAIFLSSMILYMVYKILDKLKINNYFIYLSLIYLYYRYKTYFCIDYNFAILFIVLIIMYFEFKNLEKSKKILNFNLKNDVILGILSGISILFKQTTGIFLSLIFIFYKLLITNKKEDFKITIKIIAARLLGVIIPIIALCIYFSVNNIWNDFFEYAVYGIKTFSNKKSYFDLLQNNIFALLVPMLIIYMYFISIIKKQETIYQKNIFIFFVYSVANFIVVFPICDNIHFFIGSMPAIICFIYIIGNELKKYGDTKKIIENFIKFLSLFFIIILIIETTMNLKIYFSSNNFSTVQHFKYIPSQIDERIQKVDNYILEQNSEGKEVYILDATACIYMIPLNKYNKDYDMFLKGNLGAFGEEGQSKKIEQEPKNTVILIMNDNYVRNWQTPEEVLKYITENWIKVNEVYIFDAYERSN